MPQSDDTAIPAPASEAPRPAALGDTILVEAEVTAVAYERRTLMVRITGFVSGMVSFTPVPFSRVRRIVARFWPDAHR
jgi:hypothetical protein